MAKFLRGAIGITPRMNNLATLLKHCTSKPSNDILRGLGPTLVASKGTALGAETGRIMARPDLVLDLGHLIQALPTVLMGSEVLK